MFDDLFRRYKDGLYGPLVRVATGISPNTLTVVAFVFGAAAAGAAWAAWYELAFTLWLINRAIDGLDGAVARQQDQQSDFGGYLDILLDCVVYAIIPIGLALAQPSVPVFVALAMLITSYYVNAGSWMYLAAILEKRAQGATARGENTTVTMPAGLVGAVVTWFVYALFLLWPGGIPLTFSLFAGAVFITAGQRLVWAARHLRPQPGLPAPQQPAPANVAGSNSQPR